MFGYKHYVPAIRWRQGEFSALQELRSDQRRDLTPLVDIPPIPWNFEDERPSRSIDQHLNNVPEQMITAWGGDAPIFLDLGQLDGALRMASGRHPVDELFERLTAEGVYAIPVTATDRDADYQAAVGLVAGRNGTGVCLRASVDDISDAASMLALAELADEIKVDLGDVDLVLDLRSIESSQTSILRTLLGTVLPTLPNIGAYRSFTLLSGAFPVNLSAVPQGLSLRPRADWALWLSVLSIPNIRQPAYGDYTANHPDQEEIDPRIMQVSASIRYASDTDWVIARGRALNNPRFGGYAQFNQLSGMLAAHPLYSGHSFSWASDFIDQCAAGGNTGNLTTWRKVATNRHIARVAFQIANLP